MFKFFPALACAVLASSAAAQTMYKCSEGGTLSYSDRPCTSGVAGVLAVTPAPAPDPITAERLARQHALAQQLTLRDVLEDAAARQEQQRARRAASSQKIKCDRLRLRQQWAREDVGTASRKSSAAAERKARRQAQVTALECPS